MMSRTDEQLLAKRNGLMSRDMDHIAQLRTYGIDLESKRKIDLTFWAPSESAAKAFIEASKRNEMSPHTVLGPAPSEANQRWLIRCGISASVKFVTTKENLVT